MLPFPLLYGLEEKVSREEGVWNGGSLSYKKAEGGGVLCVLEEDWGVG